MTIAIHQIGEVCSLVKGESPAMKTEPGEYPLVVTAAYRRTSRTFQLHGPAVCVPLVSSTGHGHAALHRVHYQDGKFALSNILAALIPKDSSICDAKYLYHLLTAKKDEYFVPLMVGTANVSLKIQDIAQVPIPLPSLPEQRRTVARIEELSVKIEEARDLSAVTRPELDALWASSLSGAFHPHRDHAKHFKHSARVLLEDQAKKHSSDKRESYNGAHPWSPYFEEKGFYEIPQDWVWTNLGSVLTDFVDCINDTPDFADTSTGLLGLKSTNIRPYRLDLSSRWFMTPEDFQRWNRRETPQPGDIILTREAPMGYACVLPEGVKSCLTQRLMLLRTDESFVRRRYVLHYLNSSHFTTQVLELCRGLTTPHIRVQDAPKFNMPLAPTPEQDKIVAYLDDLQAKVDSVKKLQEESEKELKALMPSFLSRAFAGEL